MLGMTRPVSLYYKNVNRVLITTEDRKKAHFLAFLTCSHPLHCMMDDGFIGLGLMGRPMAKRILSHGYNLTVYSRSRGPVDEMAAMGA
ncbi:MAG: NAD(P)-binding domain-containing protein, partial [Nitrososphaerota archaeon]